ncbi:MAG TPA: septal ring lytic transglycosylase RlpA family protein [Bryobacteraceae bacterium]|nr:septal ring lytic transglycosylase RlpA family protein [Bryobacteraceae bacterium]
MRSRLLVLAVLILYVTLGVLAGGGAPPPPESPAPETGIASWYGYPYHGRHSADGEIYDMEKLTAAHRTLPFGTWVRVVNLRNERAVRVQITDRGPFIDGRIIDLSRAAARAVGLVHAGIGPVRLEVLGKPGASRAGRFAVQVGAFEDRENAERCAAFMATRYGPARLVPREGDPILWRVVVGSANTPEEARDLAMHIRVEVPGQSAFLVRLD